MARYTGPATRKSRRLRVDLVGGDMSFGRRPYPPGQAGRARIKESEYLLQGRWAGQAPEIDGVVYLADGEAKVGDVVRARVTAYADYDLAASILEPVDLSTPPIPLGPPPAKRGGRRSLPVIA